MCGRFTLSEPKLISKRFGVINKLPFFEPTYNAAPSQSIPVVVKRSPNTAVLMKWGFLPEWGKEKGISLINIRSESTKEKPYFKGVLKKRRCIIPSNGFYEWRVVGNEKVPYYIFLKERSIFGFAGLYSSLVDSEGKKHESFAIITCLPNTFLKRIHNRMPVILKEKDENAWLQKETSDIELLYSFMKSYPHKEMKAHSVSRMVNDTENDSKSLTKPV